MTDQLPAEIAPARASTMPGDPLIDERIARAYERGWRDCHGEMLQEMNRLIVSIIPNPFRAGTLRHTIAEIIRAQPGIDGGTVRKRVSAVIPTAASGTIRQTISDLYRRGLITRLDGGWYGGWVRR